MRLLFINLNRSPTYGGVERWMIDAAHGLGERGHTCVLLGRPGTAWLAHGGRLGIRLRGDVHGTWASRVLRVMAAMRAERPDLVIVKAKKAARWATWGRAAGAGGRVALFLGLTHELDRSRWIDRFTWRHLDAGVVVAHGEKRWYVDAGFGPPDKLHVLWKGINTARFDAAPPRAAATRAALGLAPNELAIGTVGRLAWQKGIGDLLDAVPAVRSRCPSARFFVIGGGRDAEAVARAAAALDGSVTLLGQRDDVPELLAALDIVVLSSRREAMAQTTLEGMAVGRPVISTTTIGADEAIEDGVSGLLVPVADPPALAEAIVGLAVDPARRAALGEAARRRIGEHFTVAHTLDRSEAVFRAIVNAAGPAAG